MTPDGELLRQYAHAGSEEAFAELVRRYVNLVYCAALRQVGGDAHLAHDVAQSVFTDLARRAHSLLRRESLTGWLYTSTYFAACKIARTESRRRQHEERFMREPVHDPATEADWEKLRPALDAAMHDLKETDREAVLLRYFENRAFAEVGAKLGVNENTARMRVERAVEKLRGLLARRGITTAVALATVISANAVQVAPSGTAASLTPASLATMGSGTLAKLMITKVKLAAGALAAAGMIIAVVIQHQALKALNKENESLRGQIAQLQAAQNPQPASDAGRTLSTEESNELLKLRAEVTQLRAVKASVPTTFAQATNTYPQTNNSKKSILLEVKFISATPEGLQSLRPTLAFGQNGIGTLNAEQFKRINEMMQGKEDLHLIGAPRVQTSSGIAANLSMTQPVAIDGENVPVGTEVYVDPLLLPETSILTLNIATTLTLLTGDSAHPATKAIQASNQVSFAIGDAVVFQNDIPANSWIPDSLPAADTPRILLVFVTSSTVEESPKTRSAENKPPTKTPAQRINAARQGGTALIMFTADNNGQFPTDPDQLYRYFKGDALEKLKANFDLLYPASMSGITDSPKTILLREKQPWQTEDGRWTKAYGFADGHAEIHSDPNGNFDDYEKDRIIVAAPPNQ